VKLGVGVHVKKIITVFRRYRITRNSEFQRRQLGRNNLIELGRQLNSEIGRTGGFVIIAETSIYRYIFGYGSRIQRIQLTWEIFAGIGICEFPFWSGNQFVISTTNRSILAMLFTIFFGWCFVNISFFTR